MVPWTHTSGSVMLFTEPSRLEKWNFDQEENVKDIYKYTTDSVIP